MATAAPVTTPAYQQVLARKAASLAGAKRKGRRATPVSTPSAIAVVNAGGAKFANGSYFPGDTVTLADGASYTTQTSPAVMNVITTAASVLAVNAGGTGGVNGLANVVGSTGVGTKFIANVSITNGAITTFNSFIQAGAYTTNPTNLASEPVTGASLVGATLVLGMGVGSLTVNSVATLVINAAGTSGVNGFATLTGTTGVGTKFTANGTISNGILTAVSVINSGSYSNNPTLLTAEPVTGGSLVGATLVLTMNAGPSVQNGTGQVITPLANPIVQYRSSGNGVGATFNATYSITGKV
jgi:hypothetical protein